MWCSCSLRLPKLRNVKRSAKRAGQGFEFRPVHSEGLTIEPRAMGEKFNYLGWVFRATGMCAPQETGKGHSKPLAVPSAADKSAA